MNAKLDPTPENRSPRFVISFSCLALLVFCLAACSTLSKSGDDAVAIQPSGAELWANNCASCHNFRDPASYSDEQWEVASLHMRVRANLTGPDYRAIRDFLVSSN
jgi:mono/diheme cytochrome c family protein